MPSNHETRNSYYLVRPTLRKKIWFVILLLLTAKILAAQTTSVTLSWNANSEPDVVGYRLYYGRTSHNYEQNIDAGRSTTATIQNLSTGTVYYFAATAYNAAGVESEFSDEVIFRSPIQTPTPPSTPTAPPNPSPTPAESPTPVPSASPTPVATSTPTSSQTPSPVPITPTPTPTPADQSNVLNVSTRIFVQSDGDNMIGGFIIYGNQPKRILLRAIGPSLTAFGVSDAMPDPVLFLFDSSGALVASNNNWRSDQAQIIQDASLAPSDDREAALVATLSPGSYTAVLFDSNQSQGVALFEFYDLEPHSSLLLDLSTRGPVLTSDRVIIGGFVIYGDQPTAFILRALGPSLSLAGVPDPLLDPVLQLYNAEGSLISQNDNWRSDQEQFILDASLAPSDDRESAIFANLSPGPYTAVVTGVDNSTGTALFEIYRLVQ
jgi:hypothetical protein